LQVTCGFPGSLGVAHRLLFDKIDWQSNQPIESIDMKETIRFKLNGKQTVLEIEGDRKLLWVLRTELGLTGTKYGCGMSICGACTVVINKEAARSCSLPVREVQGKEVTTIEGLAQGDQLHPLQNAFAEYGAVQCGFCTPGMIMNAYALLLKNPKLTREQIIMGMENNLCRCSAHKRIVQAIESVSKR
jgi:aerobic-type carbon monoxide dehydrogenase small subunit (CoxS/CutS family)